MENLEMGVIITLVTISLLNYVCMYIVIYLTFEILKEYNVEMFFEEQYEQQALFFNIAAFLYQYGFVVQDFYDPYYSGTNMVWCDAIFINKKYFSN